MTKNNELEKFFEKYSSETNNDYCSVCSNKRVNQLVIKDIYICLKCFILHLGEKNE